MQMNIIERWKLGAIALSVVSWARDVAESVDLGAVLGIALKVIEIERDRRGIPGNEKLNELLEWVRNNHHSGAMSVVIGYVESVVALLNAIGVFRK